MSLVPRLSAAACAFAIAVGGLTLGYGGGQAASGMSARTEARFGPLANYLVVQSLGAPVLTLVDISNDKVTGMIELPKLADQVLVSAGAERIIFSNRDARTVAVYDLATESIETAIELDFVPDNIVLSPDGLTVAVSDAQAGKVGLIKLMTGSLFRVAEGLYNPVNMAFDDASEYLFVSDASIGALQVIDANSGLRLDPVQLSVGVGGDGLSAVSRTPNGLYGLAVDSASSKLVVVDFRAWREDTTLNVGRNPTRPYGTADGQFMLVGNNDDRTVTVISTTFMNVEATLPAVADVTSIVTGYFETMAYVVSSSENKAVVIDLQDIKVDGSISFRGRPGPAIVTADGLKMYVALEDRNELAVIDVRRKTVMSIIPDIGNRPWGTAMALSNNYCH